MLMSVCLKVPGVGSCAFVRVDVFLSVWEHVCSRTRVWGHWSSPLVPSRPWSRPCTVGTGGSVYAFCSGEPQGPSPGTAHSLGTSGIRPGPALCGRARLCPPQVVGRGLRRFGPRVGSWDRAAPSRLVQLGPGDRPANPLEGGCSCPAWRAQGLQRGDPPGRVHWLPAGNGVTVAGLLLITDRLGP